MQPLRLTPSLLAGAMILVATASGGCNSLLDNRPGESGSDLFANEPAPDGGASTEAARDGGASVPARGAESAVDAGGDPLPPQCLVGTKPCGDVCVSSEDPFYGCGGPTCERCAPAHATATCAAGQCAIAKCAKGWADCNGVASDGCEVDLSAPASCGACGVTCAPAPNADVACTDGACVTTCQPGFADCNADPADGCETSVKADKHHCGACGRICLIGSCNDGKCAFGL